MLAEVLTLLFFFLSIFLLTRVHSSYRTTSDEVFIAQFKPTCYEDIKKYIRCTGLSKLKVNIYIDFTLNNVRGTRNLHRLHRMELNVYQRVLSALMKVFGNTDTPVQMYGFGDKETQDTDVFSLTAYQSCVGAEDALRYYNSVVSGIEMSGPRSFVPALRHVADQSMTHGQHIVFIITNGLPQDVQGNFTQIVESSWSDALVVLVGVGDGPWTGISNLTKYTAEKKFSNASYLLQNMYSDDIELLRNLSLTIRGLYDSFLDDSRAVAESSDLKYD